MHLGRLVMLALDAAPLPNQPWPPQSVDPRRNANSFPSSWRRVVVDALRTRPKSTANDRDTPEELDEVPSPKALRAMGIDPALAQDQWQESEHPRGGDPDNPGRFSKGRGGGAQARTKPAKAEKAQNLGAASLATPSPQDYLGKAGQLIKSIVAKGLLDGDDPDEVADKVVKLVATYKHPTLAAYANKALAHLADAHGKDKSEMPTAKVMGQIAKETGAPPPKKAWEKKKDEPAPSGLPGYEGGNSAQYELYKIAAGASGDKSATINLLNDKITAMQAGATTMKNLVDVQYGQELVKALGGKPGVLPPVGATQMPPPSAKPAEKTATPVPWTGEVPDTQKVVDYLASNVDEQEKAGWMLGLAAAHHDKPAGKYAEAWLAKHNYVGGPKAAPPTQAKSAPVGAVPKPDTSSGAQEDLYELVTKPDDEISLAEKIEKAEKAAEYFNDPGNKAYAKKVAENLKAQQAGPSGAKAPLPIPGPAIQSSKQDKIKQLAEEAGKSVEQKVAAIDDYLSTVTPGSSAHAYGEIVKNALHGIPPPASHVPYVAPTPPPPGAKKGETKLEPTTTKGYAVTPNAKKHAAIKAMVAKAADPSGAGTAQAKQVLPSLTAQFWLDNPEAQDAASDYKGSSGSINGQLRAPLGTVGSKSVTKKIQALEDAFEQPEAEFTQDCIVRRGEGFYKDSDDPEEDMTEEKLQKLAASVAAGQPTKIFRKGFVSTSMAGEAAFSNQKIQYEILCRAHKTSALGLYAASSSFKGENEILLNHGSVLDIYEMGKNPAGQWVVKCVLQ